MALTTEERATLTTRLSEAETALHNLTIGGMARVFVDQNSERVEFTAARPAALRAYIMELKIALGLKTVSGPMFGSML